MEVQTNGPVASPLMADSSSNSNTAHNIPASMTVPANASATPAAAVVVVPPKPKSTLESMAITPENDPYPSWTFFPASATYTPPAPPGASSSQGAPSSPTLSPRSSPSPSGSPRAGSPVAQSASQTNNNNSANSTSSPSSSTHHRILDHCFHLSIETRLKQAEAQYLASIQEQVVEQEALKRERDNSEPPSALKQDDWRRRQRSLVDEAVVLGRKGSNVEAIVDGILKSHRTHGPLQTLPRHLKHRLHLCQLTSMVFGRFDVASSTNSSNSRNLYSTFHSRRSGASRAALKQRFKASAEGQRIAAQFAQPIHTSSFCRRHHRRDCKRTCCTLAKLQYEQQQALEQKKKLHNNYYLNNVRKQEPHRVAGLVDALPAFLKCSAMSYRDLAQHMDPETSDEEKRVPEGWYRLLLELMTQAVIESYLCDGVSGVDTILDVFAYGEDLTELEKNGGGAVVDAGSSHTTDMVAMEVDATGVASTTAEDMQFQNQLQQQQRLVQQQQPQQGHQVPLQGQEVTTTDRQDDILFVKTPAFEAFSKAKKERREELLNLDGETLEQHFERLANKYPLIVMERQMTHFIARSQKLLCDPKLSQNADGLGLLIPPTTSAYADGSLSMPVSEDEDEDEDMEQSRLEEIKEEENEDEDMHQSKSTTISGQGKEKSNKPSSAKAARTHPISQSLPSPTPSVVVKTEEETPVLKQEASEEEHHESKKRPHVKEEDESSSNVKDESNGEAHTSKKVKA